MRLRKPRFGCVSCAAEVPVHRAELEGYEDPERTAPRLKNWFLEMIKTFPALNGPFATDDVDHPNVTDYGIGRSTIYASFPWSQAKAAHQHVTKQAAKHAVGFFNLSSERATSGGRRPGGKLVLADPAHHAGARLRRPGCGGNLVSVAREGHSHPGRRCA